MSIIVNTNYFNTEKGRGQHHPAVVQMCRRVKMLILSRKKYLILEKWMKLKD